MTAAKRMFRISKIYIYESNSQHCSKCINRAKRCSEYQRYTFMKAIHNESVMALSWLLDVQNIKDIHLWKQFTTTRTNTYKCWQMFRISKIYIYESNSQLMVCIFCSSYWCSEYQRYTFMKAIHNHCRKKYFHL